MGRAVVGTGTMGALAPAVTWYWVPVTCPDRAQGLQNIEMIKWPKNK